VSGRKKDSLTDVTEPPVEAPQAARQLVGHRVVEGRTVTFRRRLVEFHTDGLLKLKHYGPREITELRAAGLQLVEVYGG